VHFCSRLHYPLPHALQNALLPSKKKLREPLASKADALPKVLGAPVSQRQILQEELRRIATRMHGMMLRALHLEVDNETTTRMQEVPGPGR
jgi:hypothetical protein